MYLKMRKTRKLTFEKLVKRISCGQNGVKESNRSSLSVH